MLVYKIQNMNSLSLSFQLNILQFPILLWEFLELLTTPICSIDSRLLHPSPVSAARPSLISFHPLLEVGRALPLERGRWLRRERTKKP